MIYNEKEFKEEIDYNYIDEEIRGDIKEINNKYEGIVTLDSCAGHIRDNQFVNPTITLGFGTYELFREFTMRFLLIRWVPENDFFNIKVDRWENWVNIPEGVFTLSITTNFSKTITDKKILEEIRMEFFSRVKIVLKMLDPIESELQK